MPDFIKKFYNFFNTKYFFMILLLLFIGFYLLEIKNAALYDINSDTWLMQFVKTNQRDGGVWSGVPAFFHQEKYYLAYPIFYWLNPGLDGSMLGYKLLLVSLVVLVYLINGLAIKKIFNNWALASLCALLLLLPRYITPGTLGVNFINLRGLAFSFLFALPLSYYWIIIGIKNRRENILLGFLAALSVYLYPPFGVVVVPLFILTALIIHKKRLFKPLIIFCFAYIIGSGLFWFGHFSNPNAGYLDYENNLSKEQVSLQADIIDYKINNSSFSDIQNGLITKGLFDALPLMVLFIYLIHYSNKYKNKFSDNELAFIKITWVYAIVFIAFLLIIEGINFKLGLSGRPPFFVEHIRLTRYLGMMLVAQAVYAVYVLYINNKKFISIIFLLILLFGTYAFVFERATPCFNNGFNILNLKCQKNNTDLTKFDNLYDISMWSRKNLPLENTKVFVFENGDYYNFYYKFLSRRDANLTRKEGNIWITSGYKNSVAWFEQMKRLIKLETQANDFSEIKNYAEELGCSHILLPPGKRLNALYNNYKATDLPIIYSNKDYRLLKIN